jgi:hypothetical protein
MALVKLIVMGVNTEVEGPAEKVTEDPAISEFGSNPPEIPLDLAL